MVEVDGGVDVTLAGEEIHALIHLGLSHLVLVSVVNLLPGDPVVPEAAPDGGEDPGGLRTGASLLGGRRSLLALREGLDVPH